MYPVAFPRDEGAYLQLALKLNGEAAAAVAAETAAGSDAEDLPEVAPPALTRGSR